MNNKTDKTTETAVASQTAMAEAITKALETPAASQFVDALPALLDAGNRDVAEDITGTDSLDRLFTKIVFAPVSGEVYARERDRRNKGSVTVGYSRKVADVQIELSNTGIYTPGAISIVQGIGDKTGHLEMSIGVWNPETRKTSFLCADSTTKSRLQDWKDATCASFAKFCQDRGIDLSNPPTTEHANSVAVNLLTSVKQS